MLSENGIIAALSRRLSTQPISPEGTTDQFFDLADGMLLALRFPPGGGCLAWVSVAPPLPEGPAAEKLGRRLLRLRLARLRQAPSVAAAWDRENGWFLFLPLRPESEHDCREAAARLLDEAEITRRWLDNAGTESAGRVEPSSFSASFQLNRR